MFSLCDGRTSLWLRLGGDRGAKPFYELYFDIADVPAMQGLAMSVALLGCLIGAMVAGMMADRYGRKPLLIISAFIFLSSAYATGAFSAFSWFWQPVFRWHRNRNCFGTFSHVYCRSSSYVN